jgi:stage II sporulation protein D
LRASIRALILFTGVAGAATWQEAVDRAMIGRVGTALVARVDDGRVVASRNRALAENTVAAPGSAIKPFTLAAMIDAGVLPLHADWACSGRLWIGGHNLTCTHPKSAMPLDAVAALAYSCNEFFTHFARPLPPNRLRSTLESYGFDAGEASAGDLPLQAVGVTDVRITPMRLLMAYRKLALARREHRASLEPVFRGMEASAEYGTSRGASIANLSVAGKTGTGPEYGWFAGYAPADRPEWVLLVAIAKGSGSGDAAPVAHDVLAGYREVSAPGEVNVQGKRYRLDDYVAGVLAGEAATYRSPQALRAMAIAARTYAVRFRGRHAADGYDFCPLTHCQNFRPIDVTKAQREATDATAGELIWYQGSPADAYYSQNCAGMTESGRQPYLPAHPDEYCIRGGRHPWSAEIPLNKISAETVEVIARSASGRALKVKLGSDLFESAEDFRLSIGRTLGWNLVRSDLYSVRVTKGIAIFDGNGSGHGIGLCQDGAEAMGNAGMRDREILAAYYPGTSVGLTARGLRWRVVSGERIDLWTTNAADERWIRTGESALRAAEARAGWRVANRARLMMFPTIDSFRDATGEPGSTLASTRGGVIRSQPALDEATLRHEIWHTVIEARVSGTLPDWFREGLAIKMSGVDPRSAERTRARDRVGQLIARYGEKEVLSWVAGKRPPEGVLAR